MDVYRLPQVAIYVKDPPGPRHGILYIADQETACREYCSDRQFTVAGVYVGPAGSGNKYDELRALATSPEAPSTPLSSGRPAGSQSP